MRGVDSSRRILAAYCTSPIRAQGHAVCSGPFTGRCVGGRGGYPSARLLCLPDTKTVGSLPLYRVPAHGYGAA